MRERLDTRMVALGLAPSREKAQRLILAGAVRVNSQTAHKSSETVSDDASITIEASEKFVSRGGYKLEAALNAFAITCTDSICLDLGASTGGFTDCLLQHGAARVHAVDVGKGQLDWKLRNDSRVLIHDKCNARHLTAADIDEVAVDIATIDVSFISLTKVLPAIVPILKPGGTLVTLIKPQFEAGKKDVKKGGVVRDSTVHERVKQEIIIFIVETLRLQSLGAIIDSPLFGPAGNKEFLGAWRKS
jgi:23S rRNA (cytidine1920-2'-O)/16S rRNA (cytidine1409-2'-O)-methyltransferase